MRRFFTEPAFGISMMGLRVHRNVRMYSQTFGDITKRFWNLLFPHQNNLFARDAKSIVLITDKIVRIKLLASPELAVCDVCNTMHVKPVKYSYNEFSKAFLIDKNLHKNLYVLDACSSLTTRVKRKASIIHDEPESTPPMIQLHENLMLSFEDGRKMKRVKITDDNNDEDIYVGYENYPHLLM